MTLTLKLRGATPSVFPFFLKLVLFVFASISISISLRLTILQEDGSLVIPTPASASPSFREAFIDYSEFDSRGKNVDCGKDMHFVSSRIFPPSKLRQSTNHRRIPKIVHQTSKSRCLGEKFYEATNTWKALGDDWEYVFYDDEDMHRIFQLHIPEFSHLGLISQHCTVSGTAKADLFRYVILYLYGGVYADIDSAPNAMTGSTIQDEDDGFFVVEQYHMLSQYFMAVSPRHPLMHYTIQHTLHNLMGKKDTGQQNAAYVTGPHALHAGYRSFRHDHHGDKVDPAGTGYKPVWNGTFYGTDHRSIRVVGVGENENEYIWRSLVRTKHKMEEYKQQGMEHFSAFNKKNKETGQSCFQAIQAAITAENGGTQ